MSDDQLDPRTQAKMDTADAVKASAESQAAKAEADAAAATAEADRYAAQAASAETKQAVAEHVVEKVDEVKAHALVESPAFKKLESSRWTVSLILLAMLFIVYYGYILLLGYAKDFINTVVIGDYVTWGIILGVAVIVIAWILTLIYVVWANRSYDPEVDRLKAQL